MACLVAGALVAEVLFRLLAQPLGLEPHRIAAFRSVLVDGTLPHFEARAHTVFARPRTPPYNTLGFNDRNWARVAPPGVLRILCLGGSTTEGGNMEGRAGRYPFQLQRLLESETGREIRVLNAGISGWTTAEMLVAWFLTLQDYAPDVLVIHEGANDLPPRFMQDFRRDYSSWRLPLRVPRTNALTRLLARWSDVYLYLRLQREGVPNITELTCVPGMPDEPLMLEGRLPAESARPFVRNIASIAASARALGATVVLVSMPTSPTPGDAGGAWLYGTAENNANLARLAADEGYLFVDAARHFAERVEELGPEFLDLVHLTGRGNAVKARLVADVLVREWLPRIPSEGAATRR
jgi:lysophospholipase L1-like esterase